MQASHEDSAVPPKDERPPSSDAGAGVSSGPDWGITITPTRVRVAVTSMAALAVCGVVVTLQYAAPVLVPIVIAILLFYALDPIVDRLQSYRVPRLAASVAVVSALIATLTGGAYLLWPQVDAVVAKIPTGVQRLRQVMTRRQGAPSTIERVQRAAAAIDSAAVDAGTAAPTQPGVVRVEVEQPWRASDLLWDGSVGAIGMSGQVLTILFLTLFLLNEDDSFKRKLVRRMESLGGKRITVQILNDIAAQVETFLWVQALTSGLVAIATGLSLWWLGVEQPAVWGLLAGLLNIVPYFGPLIVTALLAAVAFLQFETIEMVLVVAGVALAITTVEGMILTPLLISRAASLNHVMIFVALAFWSWLWGVPGMLLAIPLLMVVKAVADHVDGLQGLADFLGE